MSSIGTCQGSFSSLGGASRLLELYVGAVGSGVQDYLCQTWRSFGLPRASSVSLLPRGRGLGGFFGDLPLFENLKTRFGMSNYRLFLLFLCFVRCIYRGVVRKVLDKVMHGFSNVTFIYMYVSEAAFFGL